jgi:hypothetical protein
LRSEVNDHKPHDQQGPSYNFCTYLLTNLRES